MTKKIQTVNTDLSRRNFLGTMGGAALAAALPLSLISAEAFSGELYQARPGHRHHEEPELGFWDRPRELWLYRSQTKENIKTVFWENNKIHIEGYVKACHILRDVQANATVQMDIGLLNLLYAIQGWLKAWGIDRPIVINSGYRTFTTNSNTEGSSKNSMHLYAKAADIWIPGIPAEYIGRLSKMFGIGGVGFYLSKGFIHVDVGRVRSWSG